ncbi:unnamed protein product [Urochloa humidicola]
MLLLRRDLVDLGSCCDGVRRRRGCGEDRSRIGTAFSDIPGGFPVSMSGGRFRFFCFLWYFSADVAGDMISVVVVEFVVTDNIVIYGGSNLDDNFLEFCFCVHIRFLCELISVVEAHVSNTRADLMTQRMDDGARRKIFCYSLVRGGDDLAGADLWSFAYQHEEDSGWLLHPTSGGSVPLRSSSSPGNLGFLEVLEASDSSLPDDAMVFDHHVQPVRSTVIMHVISICCSRRRQKNYVPRQGGGRHQAGSSGRRWRERPGLYKDLNVTLFSFKGVHVLWVVITRYNE